MHSFLYAILPVFPSSTLQCFVFFFPLTFSGVIYIYIKSGRREGGLDPWVGRTPWRRPGIPLQYSCLENPINRGAWQAIVHGVAQSQTQLKQLSTHTHCLLLSILLQEYSMTQYMRFYAFS